MILYLIWKSGLWRAVDREKVRFFLGWTPAVMLSNQSPPWRHFPWGRAMFSMREARAILDWLRYRIELFDGLAG